MGLLQPQQPLQPPLHPDVAAELVFKPCHLLLSVLDGCRKSVLPPGERQALAAGALHVLLACGALLRHILAQVRHGRRC